MKEIDCDSGMWFVMSDIKAIKRKFTLLNNFYQVKCHLERIVAITVEKSLIECYDEEDKKLSR